MKPYLLVLIVLFFGCKQIKQSKVDSDIETGKLDTAIAPVVPKKIIVYHIKIKHFYDDNFEIIYTNDNWDTEKPIMQTFDLAASKDLNVCYQEWLGTCKDCTAFAMQFHTYQAAEKYNASIYKQYQILLTYRKKHPLAAEAEEHPKPIPQCSTSNIY